MSLIPTFPALIAYEIAFNAAPNQTSLPPYWTDVSARTQFPWATNRGRQYELDTVPAGTWNVPLDNRDGALDPTNTASPFAPNVVPFRPCRIRALPGVNRLTADQATAGEATGYLGAIPAGMGVLNDFGYPLTITASATAYQGGQVYQAVLPSGAGAFATVLAVNPAPVVPGQAYSFAGQVRIVSGTSTATNAAILWYGNTGTLLSSTGGTAATPTSGSTTWVPLTVSGTAPAGATYAALKVEIASGSTAATTTYQVDGLQFEQSAIPTPFQTPQTQSPNLLPRVIATGSASMAATDTVSAWWYVANTVVASGLHQALNLAAAPTGHTTAMKWVSLAGTVTSTVLYVSNWLQQGSTGPQPDCVQVTAGLAYAGSYYTTRDSSADATVQITPSIYWFSASGALLSTTAGSAVTVTVAPAWSARATVTGTAPAGAVWARLGESITTPTTTTATNSIYHTAYQFEQAAAASAWTDPGPTYYIYTGLVERWPQTWGMGGLYGLVNAVGVDAQAAIAQYTLADPFTEEILALGPNFFYALNDPSAATAAADLAGKRVAAPAENSPYGSGSLAFGSSITASSSPSGLFAGTAGPVATFANPLSGSNVQKNETYLPLHKTTATPGPPTTGTFTRILAFRTATLPGGSNVMSLWSAYPAGWNAGNASSWWMQINSAGQLFLNCVNASNSGLQYTGSASVCDGNWHQVIMTGGSGGNCTYWVDGVQVAAAGGVSPTGIAADTIGAAIFFGANYYQQGYAGDLAHAVELPFAVSSAQVSNLYASWRSASSGESSGARYQRVLTWIGYTGSAAIDTGSTSAMGPANDLTGATALDALNAIALTESGNSYVSSSGAVTFKARSSRYNQSQPAFILGEYAQYGEWPYEAIGYDDDPTHLFNNIQVTHYASGQVATAQDTTSQTSYYPRILQRTINPLLYTEAGDAANYLLAQYKSPRQRLATITLHPSAMPGLFATCLQLGIGTRIRVMRRPPAPAAAIQFDGFLEAINWNLDPATGEVTVALQASPADLASYWVLAAMHTTLAAQANAGATTITINALADAAVNRIVSSMPQNQQLTLEPGTSRAETVTVVPPLPATSPGYTTATLTVTPALTFTHSSGAVVCEPLPAGVTDPTTYDTASVLGALSTTFAVAPHVGDSAITLAALSDSKANAFVADLPQSAVLWLSPGTANFEAVTVAATGVPVTYPGYTTVTVTLTNILHFPHTVGDVVCEPLPSGVTSPAAVGATTRIAY